MSNNLSKLKEGIISERNDLGNKKFSINNGENKFKTADEFFNVDTSTERVKLITSTFKVPENEFNVVAKTMKTLINNDILNIKQTEVFRIALLSLNKLSESEIIDLYKNMTKIKTGILKK